MKIIYKIPMMLSAALMTAVVVSGCGRNIERGFSGQEQIGVISREEGSGTRGAFVEIFRVETENENGEAVDNITQKAVVTNNTAVMMMTVAADRHAIGYISLGSLNDTVRALKIDGSAPSAENIKNGSYKAVRQLSVVIGDKLSLPAQDFLSFIMSSHGQQIVETAGYVGATDAPVYTDRAQSGKVVISGSSSVAPVMERLREAYIKINPEVAVEVQQSDSATGIADTIDGSCDIGMISRSLRKSEMDKGVTATVLALDGIAVIVNNENRINDLSSEQIRRIFTGEYERWMQIMN